MGESTDTNALMKSTAAAYSMYFRETQVKEQMEKLEEFVEENLDKLDELKYLLLMKEDETRQLYAATIPIILTQAKKLLAQFKERLASLELLLKAFNESSNLLEEQIVQIENVLGIGMKPNLQSVFRYFKKVDPGKSANYLKALHDIQCRYPKYESPVSQFFD